MTPRDRAERAKQLLEDAVLIAAFDEIRQNLVAKLETSGMDDVDTHHEVALSLQLLASLKTRLKKYLEAIAVDKAMEKHQTFIQKMRQRYEP